VCPKLTLTPASTLRTGQRYGGMYSRNDCPIWSRQLAEIIKFEIALAFRYRILVGMLKIVDCAIAIWPVTATNRTMVSARIFCKFSYSAFLLSFKQKKPRRANSQDVDVFRNSAAQLRAAHFFNPVFLICHTSLKNYFRT